MAMAPSSSRTRTRAALNASTESLGRSGLRPISGRSRRACARQQTRCPAAADMAFRRHESLKNGESVSLSSSDTYETLTIYCRHAPRPDLWRKEPGHSIRWRIGRRTYQHCVRSEFTAQPARLPGGEYARMVSSGFASRCLDGGDDFCDLQRLAGLGGFVPAFHHSFGCWILGIL